MLVDKWDDARPRDAVVRPAGMAAASLRPDRLEIRNDLLDPIPKQPRECEETERLEERDLLDGKRGLVRHVVLYPPVRMRLTTSMTWPASPLAWAASRLSFTE